MSAFKNNNNAPRSVLARLSENNQRSARKNERGSALVYILIAIALLAALTVTFMEPSSQQTSSQAGFRTATEVKGQVDMIRSAVQECVLRYGRGDDNIPNAGGQTEEGANIIYPIKPNSTYLDSPDPDRSVKYIRCPGNNPGGGNENQHGDIWTAGKYMPAPPDLFEDWQWYNGNDGVFFWTYTTKSDAFLLSALEKIDENYSECEADIIQSGATATDIDSDSTVTCPANATCFRVWMITNDATAVHGDFTSDGCGNAAP